MKMKLIWGGGLGMLVGYGYHLWMASMKTNCISCQVSAVPMVAGLIFGLLAAGTSRP